MQFVAPVKEEFKCKTCGEPWDPDAAVTCADCESVFCKACHDEALAKAGACPACRKSPATFKSPHRLLLSMASSLEVFCTNRCHGCPWTGPRSGYTSHVSACALHPKEFTYVDEGSIPDELRCPICHDAMVEPVALACDHVFCRKCIMASLSKNEQCPVDRSPATPGDVTSAPKFITAMLDDLPVYCQHRSSNPGPCAWSGRRRDYLGHRTVCTGGKEAAAPPPPVTLRPASPPPATLKPVISPVSAAFGGMKVEAIPEFPVCHATDLSQDLYVLAHITAPKLQSVEQRQKPLAISAVIDVSGSMSGSKLQMAMETLEFMINELSERDFLGIVAFQSTITECSRMLKMDALGKESARQAVRRLRADGCTNLSGGLKAGLDQLNMRQFASIPIDAAKPVKVEKPTWAANGLSRLFGKSQRRDSPRAEPLTFEVTVWSSPMRRDGKDMFSYSADVKLVGGPRSAIKSVELTGASNSLTPRAVDLSAGGTVRWDPVPAAVAAAEFTVTLLKERESVFAFPLAEGQTTRSFTIPPPPSVQPPRRADPAAAEWTDASGAVLLFTDGAANEGISNPAQLQAALKDWLSSSRSAVVHTFGFGADHNASLLQQLAEIGSGSYYYIQDVSTMKTSFADCLGGLLSTVAENIKLSVKANPSFTVERVLTTLKLEVDSSGSHVVTMRDMYSEETRDVLVKVKMTRPAAVGDSLAPVTFSLEFDSLISGARECVRADCALSAAAAKCSLPPNTLVDQQRSRILATEAIEAARKEADSGRVEEARRLMNEARHAIAISASAETTYAKAMVRDCDALTDCMADRAGWAATGSKQAAQVQSCHAQQRWNAPTESKELSGYDNEFKKACRAKAKR